jgi:2-dehydro-3-deoxyphosphooctonate aldolase (KDO 8-P synthase)
MFEKKILLSGPCVIESRDSIMTIAEGLKEIVDENYFDFYFKASFDKANRTSLDSYRGPGLEKGLKILEEVKKEFGFKLVTDIHESNQAKSVGEIVDIVQIPAFLCRQTDLLVEAAKTGKIVNIKKAQFLSGADMVNAVNKVKRSGNDKIFLTERGNTVGYNNLSVDFRNIPDMKALGVPVIMDATHSVQRPGGNGTTSGGDSKFAPLMAKSAIIWGADGMFFEVHDDPSKALSDGPNMIKLSSFKEVLDDIKKIYELI